MSDSMDDKAYIQELRARVSSLKAMLQEQYHKTSNLEQQLAQARDQQRQESYARETLERQLSEVQQQNAAMRALIATLISTAIDYDENDLSRCQLCEARQATADRIQHDVDCPIGKARAFLAEHPA